MKPQELRIRTTVVSEHHGIAERRGMIGRVTDRHGEEECMAADVRFPGGRRRLFWQADLQVVPSAGPWWRSLLGREEHGDTGREVAVSLALVPR